MNTEKPSRRQRLIIYPSVQKRMIAIFIFAGAAGFLGLAIGSAIFSHQLFSLVEPLVSQLPEESSLKIGVLWNYYWLFTAAFGLAYVCFLFFLGMLFSNRTAGPLYRMTTEISDMIATKNFRRIAIREGDFFSEVVESLNQAVDKQNGSNRETH